MRPDIGDYRPQPAEIAVGCEQLEAVIDSSAGAQQQRKIARENRDVFRLGLIKDAEDAARRTATLLERNVIDQHEAEALDPLRDIAWRRRRDGARDQFATAVESAITIVRHHRLMFPSSLRKGFRG